MRFRTIYGIAMIVLCALIGCASYSKSNENGGIIVKGIISNIEEIQTSMNKDTVLQLINIPPSGSIKGVVEKGFFNWNSKLPKMSVPSNGVYIFAIENLRPGTYMLYLQYFQPALASGKPPFDGQIAKGDKYLRILIPENHEMPFTYDCGEVYVRKP